MSEDKVIEQRVLNDERWAVLGQIEEWLETPMLVLGFVWLGLLVIELTSNLSPALEFAGIAIWVVFILDFALRFILAPDKSDYLKANWITALALFVPALRVFRIFRVVRVLQAGPGHARRKAVSRPQLPESRHARSRPHDATTRVWLRYRAHSDCHSLRRCGDVCVREPTAKR